MSSIMKTSLPIIYRPLCHIFRYLNTYRYENKFAIYILSLMSHEKQENLINQEDDLLQMYQNLHKDGHLDNTVVILYGDHGSRASTFRNTMQGKIEERSPFMAITFPPKFNEHRDLVMNLKRNTRVLTTHFDVHSTLHHITTFPHENTKHTNTKYGRTLFSDLLQYNRTCAQTNIEPHWCLCLRFETVSTADVVVWSIVLKVLKHINDMNEKLAPGKCHILTLKTIAKASRNIPNKEVQQYVSTSKNKECDSCIINYNKDIKVNRFTYQVEFDVEPSKGIYETTVVCTVEGETVSDCDVPEVSRLNVYDSQPDCIRHTIPMIRKFCYCHR